jgi:GTP-binding protein YchF
MERLGLAGLPASGKSSLFNALTGVADDPVARSETVVGVAAVADERVELLAEMSNSAKRVYAGFEVTDIGAKGARAGGGLGKAFVGALRDCDALLYLLRAFGGADPESDREELDTELALADLASVEQRLDRQRRALKGDRSLAGEVAALEKAQAALGEGLPVHRSSLTATERHLLAPVFLLTDKPVITVVNVAEDDLARGPQVVAPFGADALAVCVEIEREIAALEPAERPELLASYGIDEPVVPRLAAAAYHLLGRRTFLTTGEDETRAWTFPAGATAPECAGVIHTDLQRGFIRAEVIDWRELLALGSWAKAKEAGKLRVEGKDYVVADGDVLEIRFNV